MVCEKGGSIPGKQCWWWLWNRTMKDDDNNIEEKNSQNREFIIDLIIIL